MLLEATELHGLPVFLRPPKIDFGTLKNQTDEKSSFVFVMCRVDG